MAFTICVIGCGGMARSGHGPSFLKYKRLHPEVTLAGCCDLDAERAKAFAEKFSFERGYTDYAEMLDREQPDAVSLISSVEATKALAVGVIRKGFPLILEKPPGLNAAETMEIAEAQRACNVPVRVAFNRRYMPLLRRLKDELSESGEPVQNITYMFIRKGRKDLDFSTTAIHGIDAARYLAGSDYQNVRFDYQPVPGCEAHVANIYMQCRYESGATGQLIFMPMGGGITERAVVNRTNRTYFLDLPIWGAVDSPGKLVQMTGNQFESVINGTDLPPGPEAEMFETNGFYSENEWFLDRLRLGKPVESDIESGIQPVDIADHIRLRKNEYVRRLP